MQTAVHDEGRSNTTERSDTVAFHNGDANRSDPPVCPVPSVTDDSRATPGLDPRVARTRDRVLRATLEELADHGYAGLSIERIAGRAGVGKATIYRHWDGRADLVADVVALYRVPLPRPETGSVHTDAAALLEDLADRLSGPTAHLTPVLMDAAERDARVAALHHSVVRTRRRPLTEALQAGIARGELPPDVDLELLVDLLIAPLVYRRFVSREPVTTEFAADVVDAVLSHQTGQCEGARGETA